VCCDHFAELVEQLAEGVPGNDGLAVRLGFAERSWCKHRADLGFYVEGMYVTSVVSLSVTAAHRHQR